jgi:hypothetical protein
MATSVPTLTVESATRPHRSGHHGSALLRLIVLCMAAAAASGLAPMAAAASPVFHLRDSGHQEVSREYYPDDICGPRSGWTDYVVTWHVAITSLSDDTFNFVYGETGTYHTDFDDPSIPSYDSQFTEAQHGTATLGDTLVFTNQFHDYPGTIQIRSHITFVQVGDEIEVNRDAEYVSGCP